MHFGGWCACLIENSLLSLPSTKTFQGRFQLEDQMKMPTFIPQNWNTFQKIKATEENPQKTYVAKLLFGSISYSFHQREPHTRHYKPVVIWTPVRWNTSWATHFYRGCPVSCAWGFLSALALSSCTTRHHEQGMAETWHCSCCDCGRKTCKVFIHFTVMATERKDEEDEDRGGSRWVG